MAADEFGFKVKAGPTGSVRFRVREATFGNGFTQSIGDGYNNKVQSWSISVFGSKTTPGGTPCGLIGDYEAAKAFLELKAGWKSFTWTPPGESVQIRVRCKEFSVNPIGNNLYTMSGRFDQAFDQ